MLRKAELRKGKRAQVDFDNVGMVDINTTNVRTCQVYIISSDLIPNQPRKNVAILELGTQQTSLHSHILTLGQALAHSMDRELCR